MKSKFSALLLCTFILTSFSGCLKKGEDDPIISLRSRKARVVGKWKIKNGSLIYHNVYSSTGTEYNEVSYVYTDHSFTQTNAGVSSTGPFTQTSEGSLSYTIEFRKDGTYTSVVVQNTSTTTINGTWNFTGGVGKQKNKDQIVLHKLSYLYSDPSAQAISENYEGNATDITYTLKELRNKKIVLSSSQSISSNLVKTYSTSSELTFEQ